MLQRILVVVEPILWAAVGGSLGALSDYLMTLKDLGQLDYTRMKAAAVVGAVVALAAYMRQPQHKKAE